MGERTAASWTCSSRDAVAPSLAAAYAIGRIGCQLAGDGDYGYDWDGPWAMAYPNGTVPIDTTGPPDADLRDASSMGAFALLLWRWRDRWRPGTLMAIYLVGAGLERFLIEFMRRNDRDRARADPAAVGLGRDDARRRRLAGAAAAARVAARPQRAA